MIDMLSFRYDIKCPYNCYLFVCDVFEVVKGCEFKRPFESLPIDRSCWNDILNSYFSKKKKRIEPSKWDLVVMKIKGVLHLAIYEGDGMIIHTTLDRPVRSSYSRYLKHIIGVYEICHQPEV